jgi:hypothetical protein
MFEKTTIGEWVVLGLSVITALIVSLSRPLEFGSSFVVSFILSLIVLYILYGVITKVHPKSQNWGIILWVIAIVGIPIIIIFVLALVEGFIFGMAGSGPNYQWEKYSNYGISFNHPPSIPINTSAEGYSNATYYEGILLFDNPDHQVIGVAWFVKGNALSQESIQKILTAANNAFQESAPDLKMSSIQKTTHSGNTIYYVTGEGHDTTENGKMAYNVIAIWEDPPSQRDFMIITGSYKSQEDAQLLFNGVLNSIECH